MDKDRYKKLTNTTHTKAELQTFLTEDYLDHNFYRPHSMLRMRTSVEYLQSIPGYENATPDVRVLVKECFELTVHSSWPRVVLLISEIQIQPRVAYGQVYLAYSCG